MRQAVKPAALLSKIIMMWSIVNTYNCKSASCRSVLVMINV